MLFYNDETTMIKISLIGGDISEFHALAHYNKSTTVEYGSCTNLK